MAAITFLEILTKLNVLHAYIGSFMWSLLGSDWQTQISSLFIHICCALILYARYWHAAPS